MRAHHPWRDGGLHLHGGTAPACAAPYGVAAGSITTSSAEINWNCTGTYIVEFGLPGFTPGTGSIPGTGGTVWTGTAVPGSPVTITGLSASATYQAYVRQLCSGPAYSANSTAASFATPCGTVNVPYAQDFESVVASAFPIACPCRT